MSHRIQNRTSLTWYMVYRPYALASSIFLHLSTHLVLPAENVTVETAILCGHVDPALVEDVFMVGTAVVNNKLEILSGAEQLLKLFLPGLVAWVHAGVVP